MNIIAVDNNPSDLLCLKNAIKEAVPDCNLSGFTKPSDALNYARTFFVDIVFIETDSNDRSGILFAQRLNKICGRINIIFVTKAMDNYCAMYAFKVHASGYVLKPATSEEITKQMENLRYSVADILRPEKEPFYSIETKNSDIAVPIHSVLCVEYSKGAMTFHVEDMKPLSKKSFCWQFGKAVAPLLENERFLRVRRHCVINMGTATKDTDSSFELWNGMKIDIPEKVRAEANAKYEDFLLSLE